jgi:hypothetical protein
MRHRCLAAHRHLLRSGSGQSFSEYGAIIGFVGVLIALAFNMANNSLFAGVSQSFSITTSSLYELNTVATDHNN